jgi:transposase
MAMELSTEKWVLAFSTGVARPPRIRELFARDFAGLQREIQRSRERFGLPDDAPVVSCYEAGRDGFWIHRYLVSQGIENVIIDSASIEQNRRRKKIKTDRVDARKMVRMLCRWHGGEPDVFRTVRVPSEEDQDRRHLHRELKTIKGDRNRVVNRIRALLAELGLNSRVRLDEEFPNWLGEVRQWNGRAVPAGASSRLLRQLDRLQRYDEEITELEKERRQRIRTEDSLQARQVRKLLGLKAIGETGSWLLVHEVFGWRTFAGSAQLASFTGLVGAPYDSGGTERDQGITKAGNSWIRSVIIEIAWMWLRYQRQSALSRWYYRRLADGGKRMRKIGIVALARKLIIALWRYLEKGIPPEGAILVEWYTKVGLRKAPAVAVY